MKNILTTTLLAATLTSANAFADTVRLGTEGAYPPYNFVNDKGEIDGYEREPVSYTHLTLPTKA